MKGNGLNTKQLSLMGHLGCRRKKKMKYTLVLLLPWLNFLKNFLFEFKDLLYNSIVEFKKCSKQRSNK